MSSIKILLSIVLISFGGIVIAQTKKKSDTLDYKTSKLKLSSDNACNCIDSLERFDKEKHDITVEIGDCIDKQVMAYQISLQLESFANELKADAIKQIKNKGKKKGEPKQQYKIEIASKDSDTYIKYYREIERYLMEHCEILKLAINSEDKIYENSLSNNPKAINAYEKGVGLLRNNDFKAALPHFLEAVKEDSAFAFAWDNVGICYRNIGEIDKAIDAYKTSLFMEPSGLVPLQNLAVAYTLKKDYQKSVEVYEKFVSVYPKNPEGYYGLGRVYVAFLEEYETGLDYLCKAYILYVQQKSPYCTDAEALISAVYSVMKENGKEQKFEEILKKNNLANEE